MCCTQICMHCFLTVLLQLVAKVKNKYFYDTSLTSEFQSTRGTEYGFNKYFKNWRPISLKFLLKLEVLFFSFTQYVGHKVGCLVFLTQLNFRFIDFFNYIHLFHTFLFVYFHRLLPNEKPSIKIFGNCLLQYIFQVLVRLLLHLHSF